MELDSCCYKSNGSVVVVDVVVDYAARAIDQRNNEAHTKRNTRMGLSGFDFFANLLRRPRLDCS